MDIEQRIRAAHNFTPTEQQLAQTVLAMGERMRGISIKEFAQASCASIASIHRFCKKLGLEGFKELKVELARSLAARGDKTEPVDINFPFAASERAHTIAPRIELLYETTLHETRELLDAAQLDRAAELLAQARTVDIYTQSHNLYPAQMFCDRLLSAGHEATCHEGFERQVRTALMSDSRHAAVAISYSGYAQNLMRLLPLLAERDTPVVFVGTAYAAGKHPGLAAYLHVSDRESLHNRITQFASHIAVQYVLDVLYSCVFARDYDESTAFLTASLPHTHLPGTEHGW